MIGRFIYRRASQHMQSKNASTNQVQRNASLLGKYSYKKGHGDQEALRRMGKRNESRVRKSGMSQQSYGKHEEREIVTVRPNHPHWVQQ